MSREAFSIIYMNIQLFNLKRYYIFFNKKHYHIKKSYFFLFLKKKEFLPGIYLHSQIQLGRLPVIEVILENKRDWIEIYSVKNIKLFNDRCYKIEFIYNNSGIKNSYVTQPYYEGHMKTYSLDSIHYPHYFKRSLCPIYDMILHKNYIGNDDDNHYSFLTIEEGMILPDVVPELKNKCKETCWNKNKNQDTKCSVNTNVVESESKMFAVYNLLNNLNDDVILGKMHDMTMQIIEGKKRVCFLKRFNKELDISFILPYISCADEFYLLRIKENIVTYEYAQEITNSYYTLLKEYHLSKETGMKILKGELSILEIYQTFEEKTGSFK